MAENLPAIVEVQDAIFEDVQPCLCLCGIRHRTGICEGFITGAGKRVWFNSLYQLPEGVPMCAPCVADYPEMEVSSA